MYLRRKQTFARFKHYDTNSWIHSTTISFDKTPPAGTKTGSEPWRPVMEKVGLAIQRDDKEAFAIVPVAADEGNALLNDWCGEYFLMNS